MVNCPLGPDTHVKRKIELSEGLTFWFADVPEGGLTEDVFLSAFRLYSCFGSSRGLLLADCSDIFRFVIFVAGVWRKG